MIDSATAASYAAGLSQEDAPHGANVAMIRMEGVRIIRGRVPACVRKELNAAVKAGALGHLKKDGLKPEAYFHPNAIDVAKERLTSEANESIRAIQRVCC